MDTVNNERYMVYILLIVSIVPIKASDLGTTNTRKHQGLLQALADFEFVREHEYIKLADIKTRHVSDEIGNALSNKKGMVSLLKEPDAYTRISSYSTNTFKTKRRWEPFITWNSPAPKRAWEVVNRLCKNPAFRAKCLHYIRAGKRSDESIVDIPVQSDDEHGPWMIDDIEYALGIGQTNDNAVNDVFDDEFHDDSKIFKEHIPESWGKSAFKSKRGWEDVSDFWNRNPREVFNKRGLEDILKNGNWNYKTAAINEKDNVVNDKALENIQITSEEEDENDKNDVNIYGNEWEDVIKYMNIKNNKPTAYLISRVDDEKQPFIRIESEHSEEGRKKRRWEPIGRNWKRIGATTNNVNKLNKRGWEDIRQTGNWGRHFKENALNKRGWETIRLSGKRGKSRELNTSNKRRWESIHG